MGHGRAVFRNTRRDTQTPEMFATAALVHGLLNDKRMTRNKKQLSLTELTSADLKRALGGSRHAERQAGTTTPPRVITEPTQEEIMQAHMDLLEPISWW